MFLETLIQGLDLPLKFTDLGHQFAVLTYEVVLRYRTAVQRRKACARPLERGLTGSDAVRGVGRRSNERRRLCMNLSVIQDELAGRIIRASRPIGAGLYDEASRIESQMSVHPRMERMGFVRTSPISVANSLTISRAFAMTT